MKTKIFKGNTNQIAITARANDWAYDHRKSIIVVHTVYFYDRIDEKHTVVVSYHK